LQEQLLTVAGKKDGW